MFSFFQEMIALLIAQGVEGKKRFSKLGIWSDGALVFGQRLVNALFGFVTALLIARWLDPVMQGWYYGFLSLASVYTLFDLGLERTLVTRVSRQANCFRAGRQSADLEEVGSAAIESLKSAGAWYFGVSIVFVIILLPLGLCFFGASGGSEIGSSWRLAWFFLVISTAGMLLLMPFLAFLEGIGQIRAVTKLRLLQGCMAAILCWVLLKLDLGPWAPVSMSVSYCGFVVVWLGVRHPGLISLAFAGLAKRLDIGLVRFLNSQWRVAISWVCAYLTTQSYTLILMYTDGASAAGRFGLSMALVNMIGILGLSTASSRLGRLGQMCALNEHQGVIRCLKVDGLFFAVLFVAGAVGMELVLWLFRDSPFVARLLSASDFLMLFIFMFAVHLVNLYTIYLRSYLVEALVKVQLVSTIFLMPMAYWAAEHFGESGLVVVLLTFSLFVLIPWAAYVFLMEIKRVRLFALSE